MKRLLAAALMCAVVLSIAVPVMAATFVTENLTFRTHKVTAATGEVLDGSDYLCNECFVDSIATGRVGAATIVLDTTVAVSTADWDRPLVSGAALDTMNTYCIVNVFDKDGASSQASMDSIYLAVQGSANGSTWVTLGTFKAGTPASLTSRVPQTYVAGTFFGLATQSSSAFPAFQHQYKLGLLSANQTSDVFSIQRWPLLRWVVGFSEVGGYKVRATVTHRKAI
jgi:hypothetical protein